MGKKRTVERGRLKDEWGTRYFVEIDEAGRRHKYVFGPGFLGEIDERTGAFDLINFTSASHMKDLPAVFNEEWPDYESFEEASSPGGERSAQREGNLEGAPSNVKEDPETRQPLDEKLFGRRIEGSPEEREAFLKMLEELVERDGEERVVQVVKRIMKGNRPLSLWTF